MEFFDASEASEAPSSPVIVPRGGRRRLREAHSRTNEELPGFQYRPFDLTAWTQAPAPDGEPAANEEAEAPPVDGESDLQHQLRNFKRMCLQEPVREEKDISTHPDGSFCYLCYTVTEPTNQHRLHILNVLALDNGSNLFFLCKLASEYYHNNCEEFIKRPWPPRLVERHLTECVNDLETTLQYGLRELRAHSREIAPFLCKVSDDGTKLPPDKHIVDMHLSFIREQRDQCKAILQLKKQRKM